MKAYRSFGNFTPHHEFSFAAWLYRIATNEANQRFRLPGWRKEFRMDDLGERALEGELLHAKDELKTHEAFFEIHRYLKKLRSRYQTVLTLHYFEGLPLEEIARVLKENPNTIRTWHRRALQELRRYIE